MSDQDQRQPDPCGTDSYEPPRLTLLGTLAELTHGQPFAQVDDGAFGSDPG